MKDLKENSSIIITGHILIRDTETNEILLNKSESSLIDDTVDDKRDDIDNG